MIKRAFYSMKSFEDAAFKAKMEGFLPIKQILNKKRQYVVFARRWKMEYGTQKEIIKKVTEGEKVAKERAEYLLGKIKKIIWKQG